MKRTTLFTTLASVIVLALTVSMPTTSYAHKGHADGYGHKVHKHHHGHKHGHTYGHYKHHKKHYKHRHHHHRPHHYHGYRHGGYYYPAYQPILGFMYYLDQKDTYYDRYGYN